MDHKGPQRTRAYRRTASSDGGKRGGVAQFFQRGSGAIDRARSGVEREGLVSSRMRAALSAAPERTVSWKWQVCGLLLFASMINYMDRQTLANVAVRITDEFHLSQEQYGNLELVFGWAFAVGSLVFGFIADAVSVRWLYPAVLVFWAATGFA